MKNSRLIIVGISIFVVIYGYGMLTQESTSQGIDNNKSFENENTIQNDKNNSEKNHYYIEDLTEKLFDSTSDSDTINHTNVNPIQKIKPTFKVGDKYLYEYPHIPPELPDLMVDEITLFNKPINCVREYVVVDRIMTNKTSYFKIRRDTHKCTIGVMNFNGMFKSLFRGGSNKTLYINTDNGKLFEGIETGGKTEVHGCFWNRKYCWYDADMLTLDDNVTWQKTRDITPEYIEYVKDELGNEYEPRVKYVVEVQNFSVKGREKIDGIECFKVKEEIKLCSENSVCKTTHNIFYFIDVEKRILVKYHHNYKDIYVEETNLIKQNYFNRGLSDPNYQRYDEKMKVLDKTGYCGDGVCKSENNETQERCCVDCGCPEDKVCRGLCMQDEENASKFFSEEHNFEITLPNGWKGGWKGNNLLFEPSSGPLIAVEVYWDALSPNISPNDQVTFDILQTKNNNFTIIYYAATKEYFENSIELYSTIKNSFKYIKN